MTKPISQAAISRALGISQSAVTKLKHQGMPVDSVESAQAWRETSLSVAQRRSSEGKSFDIHYDEDYQQARTRREVAEANLAEMKQAEQEGTLIRADAVRAAWAAKITGTRDALLQIPARVGPVLAATTDLVEVTAMLEAELRQALSELSEVK